MEPTWAGSLTLTHFLPFQCRAAVPPLTAHTSEALIASASVAWKPPENFDDVHFLPFQRTIEPSSPNAQTFLLDDASMTLSAPDQLAGSLTFFQVVPDRCWTIGRYVPLTVRWPTAQVLPPAETVRSL